MYICKSCNYKTGMRKQIRQHTREVHKIRGENKRGGGMGKTQSQISLNYYNTDYVRGKDLE